eukprot:COSAG06_NODE_7171_length_2599_cov_1.955200_4_plen_165_part_00
MRGQLEPNVCCSIIWERKNRGKGQRGKRPECRGHSHLNVRVLEVEGAEDVTLQHNTYTRLDGNGVFVSGYTRNVNITDSEFVWIGCNPMASWGYTKENDGMDGQQPRYTFVARNYVHEWGHYEKQSSMWSNNKACLAQVEGNIAFNGPRAGINFNDGKTQHTSM